MAITDLSKENYEYLINELNKENSWVMYQTGDIFKRPDINMLIHHTNCFHNMNSGIAYLVKEFYPNTSIADRKTKYGDKEKLGHFSLSLEKNINTGNELVIFNLYTQYYPGTNEHKEELIDSTVNRLKYLKNALTTLADFLCLHQLESPEGYQVVIGVPWMIGCSYSKENINEVFSLFRDIFKDHRKYIKILFVDKDTKNKG